MDTKDYPVISILSDQKRFVVPIYQRRYSWRDDRLNAFWEDVVAKAEEVIETKPKFKHYMGALIIAPGSDGYIVGVTPRVQVVDGQQRLTTFQIFLAALREVSASLNCPEVVEAVKNYIFNRPMTGDTDVDARYKLVPTPNDKKTFHNIMDLSWTEIKTNYPDLFFQNGKLKWGNAPNAIRAFKFFIDKIEDYTRYGIRSDDDEKPSSDILLEELLGESFEDPPEGIILDRQKRLHALLDALLNQLKLVVITLGDGDDAQVIFETLNSKAEPLLAMDLVKNNIFHRAEAQGESAEKLFETRWTVFDDAFWATDSPRAKPRRPRIDHFLSHALTAQTGDEASLRELYAEYRSFSCPAGTPRFKTVESELDALLQFVPVYRTLEEGKPDGDLAVLGTKLNIWEVATAYPLVFCTARAQIDGELKRKIYRLIYSYIVRRAVCGLTPKNLNKNFQRIVGIFLKEGVSMEAFVKSFDDQTGPSVRFPSDDDLRLAILKNPIYEWILKKERLHDILWELERKSRTKYSVNTERPTEVSVEHVLPQSWMTNWPLPSSRIAPEDKVTGVDADMRTEIVKRDEALHTLGNLTLVTGPANTAASKSAFSVKRYWLKQSLLALNLQIVETEEWGETQISDRGNILWEMAIEIWPPLPDLDT